MRKWRPTHKCVYVIPEVRGNAKSLEIIFNRILPLRISEGSEDMVIFLGDYIDGHDFGSNVIDLLINVKIEYGDRCIFLRGDHEELLLRAIDGSDRDFDNWVDNDGRSTIASYIRKKELLDSSPYSINRNRLKDLIPENHISFFNSLQITYSYENYLFFHGSFDHKKTIAENNLNNFIFDMTASKYVKNSIYRKENIELKDDYIFVGCNNYNSKEPFLYKKYFMLGGSAPKKLFLFELNSMTAAAIKTEKSRIYKYNFKYFE